MKNSAVRNSASCGGNHLTPDAFTKLRKLAFGSKLKDQSIVVKIVDCEISPPPPVDADEKNAAGAMRAK